MSAPPFPKGQRLLTASRVQISQVVVGTRLRGVSAAGVANLMASITELGEMKDAIDVRKKHSGELHLIAGAHRLQAAIGLGWTEVPAKVWTNVTDDWARLMEVDDNVAGAELNALDTAVFLAERKRLYEKLHPEVRGGVAGGLARQGLASDIVSFADATAEKFGLSARHVQRMVAAGGALSAEDIGWLRVAPKKVTLKDLQVLAKVKPEARGAVVEAMARGEAKSAADALKSHNIATGKAQAKVVLDPVEAAFKALREAWSRGPKVAKRRFVSDTLNELKQLIQECERE